MRRALALAERGWGQTAPNPMVGAVVVRGDEIVGEGYHERYGGVHAEARALAVAGARARGASLYVNLEPCAHHGKTPPCTDAIISAGITRVIAAVQDPTPAARGGADRLRAAGIEVVFGPEADAARELNAPFFHALISTHPWTTLKLAVSADGAIAAGDSRRQTHGVRADRSPRWLTGESARAEVHRLRANSDAIAVGIGTVLADDPQLTVRRGPSPRRAPTRVVFDRHARLPLDSTLVRTARQLPTVAVVATAELPSVGALRERGVEIIAAESIEAALERLAERGIRSLLVEGGAGISAAFLDAGVVDRLVIFQAPIVLGPDALQAFSAVRDLRALERRLKVRERRKFGDDVMTVYELESD